MNVCFVNMPVEYYSPVSGGAVSTVTAEVTAELIGLGHHVTVLTYTDDNSTHGASEVISLGAMPRLARPLRSVDRLTRRLRGRPFAAYEQYARRVRRALRKLPRRPDIIISHNDFALPTITRRPAPGAKSLVWLHNEPSRLSARELQRLHGVVAVSDYIRDRSIAAGVPTGQVWTVQNGVNLGTFHPGQRDWAVPRVLCIGRLDPNKGFHLALKALASARALGVKFDLTLAGARWWYGAGEPTPYEDELLAQVQDLGGTYVGLVPRDGVPETYRQHDLVFGLSLTQDPYPLVIHEAMASGCAVIASARGGIPQAAGDAAILVDPDDDTQVAAATMRLLDDRDELRRWQGKSVARAQQCSWRTRAQSLVAVADELGVK